MILNNYSAFALINNLKTNITIAQLPSRGVKVQQLLTEYKDGADAIGHSQCIVTLAMGTVVNEGGILTEDGYILEDTQTSLQDQHKLKNQNRNINNENPMFFSGKLAVIASAGSENWYHWLLQVLPRLIMLDLSKIDYDRIYINNLKYEWQNRSLDAVLDYLKIPREKLCIINGNAIIQAETLIVPCIPFIPLKIKDYLPSWMQHKLREIFLNNYVVNTKHNTFEKIYISRKNASIRRITNEATLTHTLKTFGFKILHLETLSPQEQAKFFNKAKIIVGPHGSGFANLIFANPGYKLIEIDHGMVGAAQRSFYKKFTSLTRGHYIPFYVDRTTEEHLEDDIIVNIEKFISFLKDNGAL
ncbi:DUF563 domain-containing protein [Candidatus Cardinium hertigii]|uniref:DUF563 domain-containing protein n=2 Tax=Candidatus Cardinium hertigii TaxID=247481 RepID=A0A3N2QBU6_9BACT|nr:DUF563 domain-containing protein [Candidatus Cardinium hertigii]